MTYDLIIIGSITKDSFLITDRGKIFRTPQDKLAPAWLGFELGEKICIEGLIENIGGVATNVAIGTCKLGLKSAPLGIIGKDVEGDWILNEFKKEKVDKKHVMALAGRKSPVSTLIVDKNTGERVIFYEKSSGQVDLSGLGNIKTKYLFVSSLTGNCANQIKELMTYTKKTGARLISAPSTSQIRNDSGNLKKLLSSTEIVFLNKNEAIEIAFQQKRKFTDVKSLINFLHDLGPDIVCLTDGVKGAWVSDRKIFFHSPIKKVRAIELTGAGDALAAGFLGFFLNGAPLKKCLRAGIVNSASVVQYVGTTRGLLEKKELMENF